MELPKPGQNPRELYPRHRERGRKRWSFTFDDLAAAGPMPVSVAERVDATDLAAVAAAINVARGKIARRLAASEIVAFIGADRLAHWEGRWPRFDLWRCSFAGCARVLLARGACARHGGSASPLQFIGESLAIGVRVGERLVPLHRLMLGEPRGVQVHHRDGNVWNNNPTNLLPLSPRDYGLLVRRAIQNEGATP